MEEKDRKILVEMIFLGLTPALAATINTVSAFTMGVGIIFIMVLVQVFVILLFFLFVFLIFLIRVIFIYSIIFHQILIGRIATLY